MRVDGLCEMERERPASEGGPYNGDPRCRPEGAALHGVTQSPHAEIAYWAPGSFWVAVRKTQDPHATAACGAPRGVKHKGTGVVATWIRVGLRFPFLVLWRLL